MTSVDALRGEFRQLLRELHRKRIQQAMMTLGVASAEDLGLEVVIDGGGRGEVDEFTPPLRMAKISLQRNGRVLAKS